MTLFGSPPATARNTAIAVGWAGSPDEWKVAALAAVKCLCEQVEEFTTDDLPPEIVTGLPEPRALGGLMTLAKRNGYCVGTDRTRVSKLDRNHNRPKMVWKSLLYKA